jgi:DNA repair protein RecO (recombination protein O)
MKISTPGIVLKTSLFKESSIIVRLFTLKRGKSSYVIKAAMRQKSPLKAIYQQMNEVEVNYVHNNKRQLQPIYDSKIINNWDNINTDLRKTILCLSMIEMIDKGFDETTSDQSTYYLIKNILEYFNVSDHGYNNAFYFFLIHFLSNTGYSIIDADEHPIIKRYITKEPNLLDQLKEIYNSDFVDRKNTNIEFSYNKKIMANLISDLVKYHLPDIKSFSVAKEIFKSS